MKKLSIYAAMLLGLAGCAAEDFDMPSAISSDGELTLTLSVPETDKVNTRAGSEDPEFAVKNMRMLIYSGSDLQKNVTEGAGSDAFTLDYDATSGNYRLKYRLDEKLRTKTDLHFYFLANLPTGMAIPDKESVLKSPSLNSQFTLSNGSLSDMVMSAYADLGVIRSGSSIALLRNAAKITVTNGSQTDKGWQPGNTHYPFDLYGDATTSSPVAATLSSSAALQPAVTATGISADSFRNCLDAIYTHPTENKGRDAATRPFLIIKYPFNGTEYYYRVELESVETVNGKTSVTTLNLLPNHEYRVIVTGAKGEGDLSPEAAAKNPGSLDLLEVNILDVCPRSYNMISDGMRELGVSHQVVHVGNPTNAGSNPGSPELLYVKVYSPDDKEYPAAADNYASIKLKGSVSWLSFGTPKVVTATNETGNPQGSDADTKGMLFSVPVNFLINSTPGDLEATATVTWKGLSRDVEIIWAREFDGKDLCDVSLSIINQKGGYSYPVNDYWDFLHNTVEGVKDAQNNDRVRDSGLHFPLGFGASASCLWKYQYGIHFKDLNDGRPYDWKLEATGVRGVSLSSASGTNESSTLLSGKKQVGRFRVTVAHDPSVATWDYQVGKLILKVKAVTAEDSPENWASYSLDLYHCGFFDNPKRFRTDASGNMITPVNHTLGNKELDKFLYYEVRRGPDGQSYWLDRNLGATSACYYIESAGDMTYYGDSEGSGDYFRVAKYNVGNNPEMYSDLCPPGFEIPTVETWNLLRNSPEFVMTLSGTYYRAYFTTSNGDRVYFPRSRYYDANEEKTGESRAGYYWTRTASSGLEKDHIGNWLRYLQIAGSIASYDNAMVEGRNGSKGFAMSARCVRKSEDSSTQYRTHFNVAGATHVFLYSFDDNGNRNPVTNWPGQAIGNYQSMTADQYFDFIYNSPTTPPENMYVLFTYRDADGIWHTMSKGENGNTVYSRSSSPSDLTGWKVVGDTWKDPSGNNVTTRLGGFWRCSFDPDRGTASVTFTNTSPLPNVFKRQYCIFWDKGADHSMIEIKDQNTGNIWTDSNFDYWWKNNGTHQGGATNYNNWGNWFNKYFSVAVEGSESNFNNMVITVTTYKYGNRGNNRVTSNIRLSDFQNQGGVWVKKIY